MSDQNTDKDPMEIRLHGIQELVSEIIVAFDANKLDYARSLLAILEDGVRKEQS